MSKGFLKKAFISSLLTLSVLSGAALANTDLYTVERDSEGFMKEPACGFHTNIKKYLEVMSGQSPTGIKASNDKWDMEIYSNTQNNTWTLVGKSKDPSAKKFQLCYIAQGTSDQPYAQQAWYQAYFGKTDIPQTANAVVPGKPSLN